MNPILLIAAALLIPSLSFADLAPLEFREEDGSPSTFPHQTRVPNGTLTDNADGTISLVYAGAPSGGLFTAGSIPFGDGTAALAQNNANLFWDNALIRLGIGTSSPSAPLHVVGDVRLTGTGPDWRFIPTGGKTIHLGAEASGSNTIFFLSNSDDDAKYFEVTTATHDMNFGHSSGGPSKVPSMVFKAQQFQILGQRQTVAGAAGVPTTIQAGGATSGATNQPGGNLILSAGQPTGTGASNIQFRLPVTVGASSGTSDVPMAAQITMSDTFLLGLCANNLATPFNYAARWARGSYDSLQPAVAGDLTSAFFAQAYVGPTNGFQNSSGFLFAADPAVGVTDQAYTAGTIYMFSDTNLTLWDSLNSSGVWTNNGSYVLAGLFNQSPQVAPSPQTAGNVWHDSTMLEFHTYTSGIAGILRRSLFCSTQTVTVSNTATETTLVGTGSGTMTLPADFLVAGKTLEIHTTGIYGTQAAPVTLRIRVKLGSTVVLDTGDQTPTGGLTNRGWDLSARITCYTAGATGTVAAQGMFRPSTSATAGQQWDLENTATVTIDTTASQTVDITADWGAGVAVADTISQTNLTMGVI